VFFPIVDSARRSSSCCPIIKQCDLLVYSAICPSRREAAFSEFSWRFRSQAPRSPDAVSADFFLIHTRLFPPPSPEASPPSKDFLRLPKIGNACNGCLSLVHPTKYEKDFSCLHAMIFPFLFFPWCGLCRCAFPSFFVHVG